MKRMVAPAVLLLIGLCLPVGCRDDGGRPRTRPATVSELPRKPLERIVSFSPALTRMLLDMGMGDRVVGVTRFCRLPTGEDRPRVGDALSVHAEAILRLEPDGLLVQSANLEPFKGVTQIAPEVRVVPFELERLEDVRTAVRDLGKLTGREDLGERTLAEMDAQLARAGQVGPEDRPRVLFVMGTDRPTAAGGDNFVGDVIEAAGGLNAGADIPGTTRWRPTTLEAILNVRPDVLVCQVADDARAEDAKAYWMRYQRELPAATAGRVFVVTDPGWSIPSTHLGELAVRLAEMLAQSDGEPAP